ncbi:MAG TPA: mannose-6-phosphate isomerase, class I, partial [Marisediminicola sp.]|nr:mannose-6-phosphate isomerase, class I [Marisediminicola sp.]
MFVGITNTPRAYAWGSRTAIADLLGWDASGGPEAELWLGAHPGSPSRLEDPSVGNDLVELIESDPASTLGPFATSGRLPFLLKLLAADAPLSLQAHPTTEQAREGYRRENEAGVPLEAPHRNYKDEHPKPELIVALSDTFDALCGFRSLESFRQIVGELRGRTRDTIPLDDLLERAAPENALPALVEWLSNGGTDVDRLVALVSELAAAEVRQDESPKAFEAELGTVSVLAEQYPGDPGVVISLLANRVTLRRGEALYLPAGNIHAYLHGLGVELMTASDNVLRGGLTPKHVDVPELLDVLDFTPQPVPYLEPERPAPGVEVFRPDVPDFVLVRFDGSAPGSYELSGPAIALCTSGSAELAGVSSARLK